MKNLEKWDETSKQKLDLHEITMRCITMCWKANHGTLKAIRTISNIKDTGISIACIAFDAILDDFEVYLLLISVPELQNIASNKTMC